MLGKYISDCEDSLTAAVLPHLMHLSAELFWQILRGACCTDTLPSFPGELLDVNFWPKWNPEGTHNVNYVEPDAFIRFDRFDLIIEAKREDSKGQGISQWKRELTAYANVYGEERAEVRMIALGGNGDQTADTEITALWKDADAHGNGCPPDHKIHCPVHKCKWTGLLSECLRHRKELKGLKLKSSQTHATLRILDDTIALFAHYGFSTGRWFSDFDFSKLQLSPSIAPHLQLFQCRRLQFQNP